MLEASHLSARRGAQLVFRDISFSLRLGETLLVTGANGSGKSSLLRVVAGLLSPRDGTLLWDGQRTTDDATDYRSQLHYMGHLDSLKPSMTVGETLSYWCALYNEPKGREKIIALFGDAAFDAKPIRALSAGQRRRLSLTRLLLVDRPIWILDEPTTSLDSTGLDYLTTLLKMHADEGGLAIVASHHKLDVANACPLSMEGR